MTPGLVVAVTGALILAALVALIARERTRQRQAELRRLALMRTIARPSAQRPDWPAHIDKEA